MADENITLSVAGMRRRRKAREALNDRIKDTADALVVSTRAHAGKMAAAKAAADTEAAEALAVSARLYGSAEDVSELTGIPTAEVERAIRAVGVPRVKDILDGLYEAAEAKLSERQAGKQNRPAPTAAETARVPAQEPTADAVAAASAT